MGTDLRAARHPEMGLGQGSAPAEQQNRGWVSAGTKPTGFQPLDQGWRGRNPHLAAIPPLLSRAGGRGWLPGAKCCAWMCAIGSRRCTQAASGIIIILIMKGQSLQRSSPLRCTAAERGMQRSCVSLIPSSHGATPIWVTKMPREPLGAPRVWLQGSCLISPVWWL